MNNEIRDIYFATDPLWLCSVCGHKVTYGSNVSRFNGSWVHEPCEMGEALACSRQSDK